MSKIEVKLDGIDTCIATLKSLDVASLCYPEPESNGAGDVHDCYHTIFDAFDTVEVALTNLVEATVARLTTVRQSFEAMDSAAADAMLTSGK